jgi:hypothetical protein
MCALIAVCSCGGGGDNDDDNDCTPYPAACLLLRIELQGTCGSIPPVACVSHSDFGDGCTGRVEMISACFRTGEITCRDGFERSFWLDGTSGTWSGEDRVVDPVSGCASRYAVTVQPK